MSAGMRGFSYVLLCVVCVCVGLGGAQQVLLGTYSNNSALDQQLISDMQTWQARKLDTFVVFDNWCSNSAAMNRLNQQLLNVFANDQSLVITWMPTFCGSTPNNVDSYIASGSYDTYISEAADIMNSQLNQYISSNIYIRLAHEPNTDVYPWSASYPNTKNTPTDYISMWRHVYTLANTRWTGTNRQRVNWVWSVNSQDVGKFTAEQYWPGLNYVDWVGIDGFNYGQSVKGSSWVEAPALFGPMLARVLKLGTGLSVVIEFATTAQKTSGSYDQDSKNSWLVSAVTWFSKQSSIGLISYYNQDNVTDWAVFGGAHGDTIYKGSTGKSYNAYSGYLKALQIL